VLSEELNVLLTTTYKGIDHVLRVLAAIAEGDLSKSIEAEYSGIFAELKNNTNNTVTQLKVAMSEIDNLVSDANNGNFKS